MVRILSQSNALARGREAQTDFGDSASYLMQLGVPRTRAAKAGTDLRDGARGSRRSKGASEPADDCLTNQSPRPV